jgi:hypothetical protein
MFGRTELLDRFAGSLTEVRKTGKGWRPIHRLRASFRWPGTPRRILAVRGRRQVGKSTAVTAFVEQVDTPHAYFTAGFSAGTTIGVTRPNSGRSCSIRRLIMATSEPIRMSRIGSLLNAARLCQSRTDRPLQRPGDQCTAGVLDAEFTDAASARQVLTAIGAEAVIRPGFNDAAEVAEALPGRSAGYPRLVERCAAARTTSAYRLSHQ